MEFKSSEISFMERVVDETQNLEQTQEIKISDDMPDIGNILASWGQMVLRSKEWRTDSFLFSGGLMTWVIYNPEDGTQPRTINSWIPFQMKWDLPENCPEGRFDICGQIRFIDSRSVSPRKIMVRAGVAASAKAYVKTNRMLYEPAFDTENVEFLRRTYPMQLVQQNGERAFTIDEDLNYAPAGELPFDIVYYTVNPEITDQKVLSNKLAFRGNAHLHVLFADSNGKYESQDYTIPFSQFEEMDTELSSGASATVHPFVTNLEIDNNGESIHLKCGITAQYTIFDSKNIEIIEDAYSISNKLSLNYDSVLYPSVLDRFNDSILFEQAIPDLNETVIDISFMPDYPHMQQMEGILQISSPGTVQILLQNEDGVIKSSSIRVEGSTELRNAAENLVSVSSVGYEIPQLLNAGEHSSLKMEVPIEIDITSNHAIDTIIGIEQGEKMDPNINRPSLILRRAGNDTLWEIAKASGSTVTEIQKINLINGEPLPGQMLIIPVI